MLFPGAEELLKGSPAEINEQMCIDQQTELLPYDIRWEFPRNRLKLGLLTLLLDFRHFMELINDVSL